MATVQPGSFLTLHYRLAGPEGDVINTFEDKPATLTLGNSELSPVLEERLLGLEEGTRTSFELAQGEAFGERNPAMQQWVSRKLLDTLGDPDEQYHVGDLGWFRYLQWLLAHNLGWMLLLTALGVGLISLLLFVSLRARARARLNG